MRLVGPGCRCARSPVLLAAWLAAPALAAGPAATVSGEAVKVDLVRRQLVVRTTDPPRETAYLVDAARTRIVSGGRPLELERVHPGDWVLVAYESSGAQRVALLVRAGASRPSSGARR